MNREARIILLLASVSYIVSSKHQRAREVYLGLAAKETNRPKFHKIFTTICRAEPLCSLGKTGEQEVAGSIPGLPNILSED